MSDPGPASLHTRAAHAGAANELPFEDREDFADAQRGLIATSPSLVLRNALGRIVWDMDSYAFVGAHKDASEGADRGVDEGSDGDTDEGAEEGAEGGAVGDAEEGAGADATRGLLGAPDTVHPSLWRMAQLNGIHGLFEVVPGIYQVRGYDISNMTLVEGRSGVIVIDPLISSECAAAALALYRAHRGERKVSAVIYTHSHVDHFGGVKGVVSVEEVQGGVPVWAPAGFLEHAVSENVLAGGAMARRAAYMFAPALERSPRGQVDAGIGKTSSTGSITLIPPTREVGFTGEQAEIDGVSFVFQLVPDSEAPAEMNFFFKDLGVLCVAENAVHCMHNVVTPRGAPVRDSLAWSKYLGEAIELFGRDSDAMFAQHHWPRWGKARIVEHLARHRDMYRYLHDQTLRLANRGLTPTEIAAEVSLPPSLARTWSCRGYYGTVSHNVRAVYQRYLGFFDGNPAHLNPHPPVEAARRYVQLAGGIEPLLANARQAFEQGDYRWAAELCSHAVFAEPEHAEARELHAQALEQLGYQSESAAWRNLYLVGAHELREGPPPAPKGRRVASADVARALSIEQLWDAMGARLDGPRAWGLEIKLAWDFTDVGERWSVTVENGALSAVAGRLDDERHAEVTLTRAAFDAVLLGEADARLFASGAISVEGDAAKLGEFLGLLDEWDPAFAIVTP
ncbi:MAG TPA: alkyl sulfatase dimerization domain-containing protein [Solirubrobacteraceae bacterium]|nr:alkyl sulfatase dimerization domain-containing protein [Solirubrobacteraceae bacterium]